MDNKSELSKPVAEVVSKFGDPEAFGEREIKLLTGIQQMAYGTKFYSQEYVSALLERIEELESTEIKPEGMGLMSEAIGAHGYIVGCLVQGRPDLALEESRKWVDAFSQAAELIKNG
ncbi:hypothetical protein [Serratia bockelmannii]|uniref:hypothetical protein n=1 Tax=Serratia bockelmannii TaxID=2703793 RepID=UPI00313EF36F